MKLDNFYHLEYSEFCPRLYCYIPNVWTDTSFGLLLQNFEVNTLFNHRGSIVIIPLATNWYKCQPVVNSIYLCLPPDRT